jgi:hypothetical protein
MWQDMGNKDGVSFDLLYLGLAALHLGDFEHSARLLKESLPLLKLLSAAPSKDFGIAVNLAGLSELARRQKQIIRAARLLGPVEAIVASMGDRFSKVWVPDSDRYESLIAAGHEQLDEAVWLEGQAMPLEQVIEYALKNNND